MALVALLAVDLSRPALAEVIEGTILGVTDGDTITLLDTHYQRHKIPHRWDRRA